MTNSTTKTPAVKTPAVKTPAVTMDDVKAVITKAHGEVKVDGKERARALRTAAEKAVIAAYGPFTITGVIALPEGDAFKAFISGAVGRNGFKVEGRMGTVPMGRTTIEAMLGHDPKSFKNADEYKIGVKGAGKRGTIVMDGFLS
jgi:hypothetical protein